MPTNFPGSIDSGSNWNTLVNNVDTISAGHINDPRDAVIAIETLLGASSTRITSFTPSITFATTAPTSVTYGAGNAGAYARFGSLVFFTMRFVATAITGGTGILLVNYPVASSTNYFSGIVTEPNNFVTLFPAFCQNFNSSSFHLRSYVNSASTTAITNSHTGTPSAGAPLAATLSGFYFHQ